MVESPKITSLGESLVKQFLHTKLAVERAHAKARQARDDHEKTMQPLADWIKPADAKPGEKIAVWYGDMLVQVEVGGPGFKEKDEVSIRTRGNKAEIYSGVAA